MPVKITHVEDNFEEFSSNTTRFSKETADTAVIMPCNNRIEYAVKAILSVLNQDYKNLVLLCVGQPNDHVKQFLEVLNDSRVVYVINDSPTLASCTNLALDYINESLPLVNYITRCDDDDWLAPNKVRVCRNYLRMNPQIHLVHHAYQITDKEGMVKNVKTMWFDQEDLIEYSNIYDGTIMFRRTKLKLDESLPGLPFYDWFIKLGVMGWKMAYLDYTGYFYRQHASNNVKRVDIAECYDIIRRNNDISVSACDVMFCYAWLGRESGITASVKHCSSLLKKKYSNVIVHTSPNNSLYGLKYRAKICKPKLIIIEDMNTPTDALLDLMNNIDWECEVILRQHGKAAFSNLFWKKLEAHDRVIQISKWYSNLHVASVNTNYASYLSMLYDADILWLPNTFDTDLMVKQEKFNDNVNISILCEIRPLKNVITQLCACQLIGKWLKERHEVKELYVHLLESKGARDFIDNLKKNQDKFHFKIHWHPYMTFEENQRLVSRMDLAMQVSYTETMNYYALEHLMHGIHTLTSETMSFGTGVMFDTPLQIAEIAMSILDNPACSPDVFDVAKDYTEKINKQFLSKVQELIK